MTEGMGVKKSMLFAVCNLLEKRSEGWGYGYSIPAPWEKKEKGEKKKLKGKRQYLMFFGLIVEKA